MNQRTLSGMTRALFDSDLVATRLTLALAELLWALMLLWPGDTFTRPTYTAMGHVAPELCWAVVFLVSAAVQYRIVAHQLCGTRLSHWFAAFNALLWVATVGLMVYSVYPPPAAIGGEIALTCSAVWILVRPLIMQHGERKYGAATKHA